MRLTLGLALSALAACLVATPASAMELLPDPGFEDTRPLLPEGPDSDPWRLTFFTPAPVSTSETTMPADGLEHASVTKNQALPNADPQLDTAVFAGFGPAESITDFTGEKLRLGIDYKFIENNITSTEGDPGSFLRMFVSYFGASGFLGFGSFDNADVFVAGVNDDYLRHSFIDTVPDFGTPVTIVSFNVANLGQSGGTGTSTVFLDNASLTVVPEPTTTLLLGSLLGLTVMGGRRTRI